MVMYSVGLALIIIIFVLSIPSAIRSAISEILLRRAAAAPARCGQCKHEATLQMVAGGRCPECGSSYLVAGVDAPLTRLQRNNQRSNLYAVLGVGGMLIAAVASGASGELNQWDWLQPWFSYGIFLAGTALLGLGPSLLIAWRRKRIRDGIMRAMAPPSAPASVITKTDANIQSDRLESSPPSGDSSSVSAPSPTQGTP